MGAGIFYIMQTRRFGKSTVKTLYKFPSLKLNRTVFCDSTLKVDFAYLLEFDRNVLTFQEQPAQIKFHKDGHLHDYAPDFLVTRPEVKQLVTVKWEKYANSYEYQGLFPYISKICKEQGFEFLVLTEESIRLQPRLSTIKLLLKYSRTQVEPQHQIICAEFLSRQGVVSFGELVEFMESEGASRQIAYALAFHGAFEFDLMKSFNEETAIRLTEPLIIAEKVA